MRSDNPAIVSVQAMVMVPAGARCVDFPVTAGNVSADTGVKTYGTFTDFEGKSRTRWKLFTITQ